MAGKWTGLTVCTFRCADSIRKIHQRLREIRRPLIRHNGGIMAANFGFSSWQGRGNTEEPCHHPLNIAVNDNTALAKGNGADGASCMGPSPEARANHHPSAETGHHISRQQAACRLRARA